MSTFFQELYGVARHTPMSMLITPKGEQLSVIVTPKPSGDAEDNPGFAKPIHAIGTPAELDAELPGKIREYAEKVNDVRASINLPIEAVDAERAKATKKADAKTRRAEKKAAEEAAAAKKAAERKAAREKRAADAKAAREAAAETRRARKAAKAGGIRLPGKATATPDDKAAPAKSAAPAASKKLGPRSALPGKPECIADYKALFARFGKELTRKGFVKQAETKRRYEKLWDSWEAFVTEAMQLALPLGDAPAGDNDGSASTDAPGPETSTPSRTSINPAAAWPFPGDKNSTARTDDDAKETPLSSIAEAVQPPAAAEPERHHCVVDRAGHVLSEMLAAPGVGASLDLHGHPEPLVVREVLEGRHPKFETLRMDRHVVDAWPIFDLDWKPLGIWTYAEPAIGAQIQTFLADMPTLRIVEIEAGEVMAVPVKPRIKGPAATASTETN